MRKISFLILTFCLALLVISCGQAPVATVGQPAPDFDTIDLDGKIWTLSKLRGQVVFVNFWATWCPPCREEMPSMERLNAKMPADKFEMLAIYNNDTPAKVKDFVTRLGLTMPILDDHKNVIGARYGLRGLPETFIIDKQGVIREKFIGPAEWDAPEHLEMLTKYINQ
jgi:peroxiredoxin